MKREKRGIGIEYYKERKQIIMSGASARRQRQKMGRRRQILVLLR